jgi:hypothetical protein
MTDQTDDEPSVEDTMSVADIAETGITMDRLTRVYIKMRDKLAEITRDYEAKEADIKAQQAEVAGAMKDIIQKAGGTGMKTAHGTVALKTSTRYYAQDWEAMARFIVDNDAVFLLEKRIAQKNMSEYLEKNPGVVPPGLNTMSEITVSVTKPRK